MSGSRSGGLTTVCSTSTCEVVYVQSLPEEERIVYITRISGQPFTQTHIVVTQVT